jgi:hypothetical protein
MDGAFMGTETHNPLASRPMYPRKQNPEVVEMLTKHASKVATPCGLSCLLDTKIPPTKTTKKIKTPHPVSNLGLQNLRERIHGKLQNKDLPLYPITPPFRSPLINSMKSIYLMKPNPHSFCKGQKFVFWFWQSSVVHLG